MLRPVPLAAVIVACTSVCVVASASSAVSGRIALLQPGALAVDTAQRLLIVNEGTNQVLRRAANGELSVLAGDGHPGYSGDGGAAISARLNHPGGLAVAADGDVYIADTGNNRVRVVHPDGRISTFAGTGVNRPTYARKKAERASIPGPVALAFADGVLYIADEAGVQRVDGKGVLETLIHGGPSAISTTHGRSALWPSGVAVDGAGHIFVANSSPKALLEFAASGRHLIHSWAIYLSPAALARGARGTVNVADYGNSAIERIESGRVVTVERFKLNSLRGVRGVFRPSGVTESEDGDLYADTDGVNGGASVPAVIRIRQGQPPQLLMP